MVLVVRSKVVDGGATAARGDREVSQRGRKGDLRWRETVEDRGGVDEDF